MLIDDLPTPSLLVDRDRLARNIDQMQALAGDNDAALRPHVKTHKCPSLARRQLDAGAAGLTVSTVTEAELFVEEAGAEDVRVAYPVVGRDKHDRLAALMDRARISFCVDTVAGARQAAAAYAEAGRTAEVLVEIDVGHGRCGAPWDGDEPVELARAVAEHDALELTGILTHAGQAYHGPEDGETETEALERASREERDRMLSVAGRLAEAGVPGAAPGPLEISIGSTPTMAAFANAERNGFQITEVRPGNYVFNDAIQVGLEAADLDDCALTVYTTVVSKRRDASGTERVYLDAGKKVVTTDTGHGTDGYGTLLYNASFMRPHPHAVIHRLSEEHAWVRVPGGATFGVGDRLRFVPNHACVTVATQDRLHVVDGDEVVATWDVAGHPRAPAVTDG
jgi:D-serine deaminase-like pyridoxal phosphate-dependent protein